MQIAIFIIILNVVEVFSGSICPPRSHIYPCTCSNIKFSKRRYHTTISCRHLKDTNSLEYIYPALKEMEIDKFLLYDSFWSDASSEEVEENNRVLPMDWMTYTWIKNMEIADSDLSFCFACKTNLPCRNYFTTKLELRNSSSSDEICTICNLQANSEENSTSYSWLSCLSNLKEFQFTYGKITTIDNSFFPVRMDNLASLNLSHNEIKTINPGSLNSLISLKELDLSHNVLESFNGVINRRMDLELLDLSHNSIKSLPIDILIHLSQLKTLKAENNHIEILIEWRTIPDALRHIDFLGNPIHCDCNILWINKTLSSDITLMGKCKTPKELESFYIREVASEITQRCQVLSRRRPTIPSQIKRKRRKNS